jgi:hypothetical protein
MYRSADKNVPLDEWERRNAEPIPTTEYKDEGVSSGEVIFITSAPLIRAGRKARRRRLRALSEDRMIALAFR